MRGRVLLSFSYFLLVLLVSVFALASPTERLNFAGPVKYSSGGNGPNAVAIADVNGDGKPDVVVGNWCISSVVPCPGSSVGVLLGNGNGTFQSGVAYSSGGVYADFVAVADLNGDGKADIVVANCGYPSNHCIGAGGNIGVLIGNGDGTFQPVVTIPLGGGGYGAISVAVEDVNGDGKLDLIVAGDCASGGCGGVLLGNGDGTFQPEIPFSSGGLIAFALAVKDVNGDGKPDVVVGNQCADQTCTSSTVGVLLGNGNGTFQTAVTYDSGGIYPDSIVVADLNGDGKADIVVANSSTSISINQGDIGVMMGNGDGTFQTVVAYPASEYGAASVAVADMDGDGKPDVVVANCSSVSGNCNGGGGNVGVLLGNGDGTLQTVVAYAPGGNTPFGMAVGDVNGDGKPDIVVGNCASNVCGQAPGSVGVLINASLGTTATTLSSSSNPSNFGQAVTFTATVAAQGFKSTPTGTVSFVDGTTNLGNSNVNSSGLATLVTSTLAVATHSITATYSGDSNFAPNAAPALSQVVQGAVAQISPTTSVAFGNQTVGIVSSPQRVTLTNTGNIATAVSIGITGTNSGDFAQTNTCGTSVAAGGSCSITMTFTPLAIGTRSAAVTIVDNAANSPQSVSLTGTGVQPAVTFSPASLTFPAQAVFTSSTAQTVTLTNSGLGVLKITKGAITGPFGETTNCGGTLNPGSSCTVSVTFKPTTIGALAGSISVTDNAPLSPHKISLNGTGTYLQFTPAGLNFGNQAVGTTSLRKAITVKNKGSVAVNITSITITGTNAGDFAEVNNCGSSVAAGASCSIGVTFSPSATGARSAAVSVSDNGGGSPQQVQLAGTGT